ncbi:hypothetical protein [Bhargavaea cecembensis]|nr:hypothetical protein [Bhargavaea cecembensis]
MNQGTRNKMAREKEGELYISGHPIQAVPSKGLSHHWSIGKDVI